MNYEIEMRLMRNLGFISRDGCRACMSDAYSAGQTCKL